MLPGASKCQICNETSHSSRDCPTLHSPLTPGFFTGGGGGGGHSHEDDEHLHTSPLAPQTVKQQKPKKLTESYEP